MKPYLFLAIGAMWLIVATVLYNTDFAIAGFKWPGGHAPDMALSLFRVLLRLMPPLLFLGWALPVLFGSWLLWKK